MEEQEQGRPKQDEEHRREDQQYKREQDLDRRFLCAFLGARLPPTSHLPRKVDGFDVVEWLVVDDGSTDRTIEVAREQGVDHIVRLTNHKGLAAAFQAGFNKVVGTTGSGGR